MFSTLSACAGSGRTPPPTVEPDPVVEIRYETRTVCPPELRADVPARPVVDAAAVVQANPEGAAWLAAELAWGGTLMALLQDARGACPADAP